MILYTDKEFEAKKQELLKLARSIELMQGMPMTEDKVARINFMFEELDNKLHEVECQFLDVKLSHYQDIYNEMKKFV